MLLVIDSATAACSAALLDGDRLIAERHEIVGRGHAERLLPMIEELLDGLRPKAIAVDCGPGSFTGLRVGIAAAHGLAIGWRIPLTGYCSLALLAAMARTAQVAVAVHGGHGEFFVQSYGGDPLRALADLQSLPLEAAVRLVSAQLVVGSAAAALVEARGWGEAIDILPRAAEAHLLPTSLRSLLPKPIYGRAPDARPMP